MQQVSFKVKSLDDVRAFYHRLLDAGMKIDRTVTHGIACSVYFYDPEDNRIELYYTTPYQVRQPLGEPIDLDRPDDELLGVRPVLRGDQGAAAWRPATRGIGASRSDRDTRRVSRARAQSAPGPARARAVHAEQLRRLPDETFKDFQALGLFRCIQPKRYEGYELDPGTFYQAIMEVGAVCGSTAWVLGVVGVHNWHLALFPPQAQEDVWGEDTSVQLSTSLAPTGTVERVDGGFRLRGRWSFSSMCDHCQWAVLGGVVPPLREGDPPDARTFLVPRRDYAIEDNWYVMGLSGTGSKNLVVADAFVPEYRTHSYRTRSC